MSRFSAQLFGWLQDAEFYRRLHVEAATLMGNGEGRAWIDVGCGPGLLTRIAADRGFRAHGVDLDPAMIALARRLAATRGSSGQFAATGFDALLREAARFDVVSASSLLVVTPDHAEALRQLLLLLKPGGALLAIEATAEMSPGRALAKILSGRLGARGYMLAPWAAARSGRALDPTVFAQPGLSVAHFPLLDGLARASVVRRSG